MNNIFDKKYRLAHNYNTEGQSIYITFRGNFEITVRCRLYKDVTRTISQDL